MIEKMQKWAKKTSTRWSKLLYPFIFSIALTLNGYTQEKTNKHEKEQAKKEYLQDTTIIESFEKIVNILTNQWLSEQERKNYTSNFLWGLTMIYDLVPKERMYIIVNDQKHLLTDFLNNFYKESYRKENKLHIDITSIYTENGKLYLKLKYIYTAPGWK